MAEIVSEHSIARDFHYKRDLYAWYDVPEYWIVDPRTEQITIFSDPRDGRYHAEQVVDDFTVSATIPGLSIEVAPLFAPPFINRKKAQHKADSTGEPHA